MKSIAATLAASVVLGISLAAFADDAAPRTSERISLEALVAASATEPAEHQALANYYGERAAEARVRAATLRSAAKHLTGGKLFQVTALKSQRLSRAKMLEASARELDTLAAQHAAAAS
jgi:hypothetical protein